MDSLLFTVNAILPIIVLIALGYGLKAIHLVNDNFVKIANRLVFVVFLPVLLFYNIYSIDNLNNIPWYIIIYSSMAIVFVFFLCLIFVIIFVEEPKQKGVILQAAVRVNYGIIGIPLATALGGVEATAIASLVSAFSIPLTNLLATIALVIFVKSENGDNAVKRTVVDIVKNPILIGVFIGVLTILIRQLFVMMHLENIFSIKLHLPFLFKSIQMVSLIASPFALIILGADFKFHAVKGIFKEVTYGIIWRLFLSTGIGLGGLVILIKLGILSENISAIPSMIALFGTPVAVSSAVMVKELGSDDVLANQIVVWTTIVSIFTIFMTIFIFKEFLVML